jgi:hypothetical protein
LLEGDAEDGAIEVETYICGNPPYLGGKKQSECQKADMIAVFGKQSNYKNLDYICAFLILAARYVGVHGKVALVSTSSVNQGSHVPTFWPMVFDLGAEIVFGYEPFKWSNNAARNAGVYVTIVCIGKRGTLPKFLYPRKLKKAGVEYQCLSN